MNSFNGIGNLTREVENAVTANGTEVSKFTIAINRRNTDGTSTADFIPVKAFGARAGICRQYLKKGSKVGITGSLQTYTYDGKDGKKHTKFEILLDEITFVSNSSVQSQQSQQAEQPPQQYTQQPQQYGQQQYEQQSAFTPAEDENSDDLPF